jgi:DNA-directed RNA polymerase specialized sigma24 family protein
VAFVDAVRQALRDFNDPQALREGALARVLAAGGVPCDPTALRARLGEALERLAAHPRDRKFRDAIWHTYIEPMHKQEQVAAELGIPFATYRYRLQQGIERMAAALQAD